MTSTTFTTYITDPDDPDGEVQVEVECKGRVIFDHGSEGPYGSTYVTQYPKGRPVVEDALPIGPVQEVCGPRVWAFTTLPLAAQECILEACDKAVLEAAEGGE